MKDIEKDHISGKHRLPFPDARNLQILAMIHESCGFCQRRVDRFNKKAIKRFSKNPAIIANQFI